MAFVAELLRLMAAPKADGVGGVRHLRSPPDKWARTFTDLSLVTHTLPTHLRHAIPLEWKLRRAGVNRRPGFVWGGGALPIEVDVSPPGDALFGARRFVT